MVDGDGLNNRERGRITIDSGAAESVIPPDMLQGVPTRPSPGSRAGAHYIAANGARMPNLGEKHVKFRTGEGLSSSVFFQVTQTRKPLASVSKIVKKGNGVVFGTDRSYIENLQTGKQIELTEENGRHHLDVEFYLPGFYAAGAESMRLASCEERVTQTVRPKCEIFACGDVELGSSEIDVDVEIGDPSEDEGRRVPRKVAKPRMPTEVEIEEHNTTHLPYRSWCIHCVRGREEQAGHLRQEERPENAIPEVHMDRYFKHEKKWKNEKMKNG